MATKILIIEDEEEIRRVLRILLKQTGYDLLEAPDAETAFQFLKEHADQIEVAICDVKMPRISGIDILQQIKRDFDTLPVIILTGLIDLNVAVEVMKKGAFDYLTKPVKKEDLILVIEKAINHKRFLGNYVRMQQENQQYRQGLEKILDEKAKELEFVSLQIKKIREDLLKLKSPS